MRLSLKKEQLFDPRKERTLGLHLKKNGHLCSKKKKARPAHRKKIKEKEKNDSVFDKRRLACTSNSSMVHRYTNWFPKLFSLQQEKRPKLLDTMCTHIISVRLKVIN